MTGLVGNTETAEVIYFDFNTSFDTVLTAHPQSKLGTQLRQKYPDQLQNQLQNHIRRTVINGSLQSTAAYIPQGSALGLASRFTSSLNEQIRNTLLMCRQLS